MRLVVPTIRAVVDLQLLPFHAAVSACHLAGRRGAGFIQVDSDLVQGVLGRPVSKNTPAGTDGQAPLR